IGRHTSELQSPCNLVCRLLLEKKNDDVTASQGLMRNGWDASEPNMGPSVVPTFTQLFDTPVSGQVYAQPLVVGSTVVVATENEWVYGLDAATGAVNWSTHIGTAWNITKS